MGLVQYTNLEDGNTAGANDINQRFGDVLAQVNGNLDASNIRNGTLTRELFAQDAISAAWPINSVFISVEDVNPGTQLGGSWVKFGEGRTLIGVSPTDDDFKDPEKTGGTKTETLTAAQIPSHTHTVNPPATSTNNAGQHSHDITAGYTTSYSHRHTGIGGVAEAPNPRTGNTTQYAVSGAGNHAHTVDIPQFNSGSVGGGAAHNNLQPYITVYFWKRVS